jgi:hypothetical protein
MMPAGIAWPTLCAEWTWQKFQYAKNRAMLCFRLASFFEYVPHRLVPSGLDLGPGLRAYGDTRTR